ncbi:gag-Pol polyprotein [Trichonephila clavipes]|nr:gag-Pol polyprotein [Trichonephila clavipes]
MDFRAIIDSENFVSYLKRFARISSEIRERIEEKQDQGKTFHYKRHHPCDKVWLTFHPLSNAAQKKTAKCLPRGDGSYTIMTQRSEQLTKC